MPDPGALVTLVNGLVLLALTLKASWGWFFRREYTEGDLKQEVAARKREIDDLRAGLTAETQERRNKWHDLYAEVNSLKLQLAVQESRLERLEDRVGHLETRRRA